MMKRVSMLYYFRTNSNHNSSEFKSVNLAKDYYRILQVQCTACDNTIKKSYFRLAKKLHPDFNPTGHDRFTEVQEAYNILSSKQLKGYYDMNNNFNTKKQRQQRPQRPQNKGPFDEDGRNQKFYEDMRGKYHESDQQDNKSRYKEQSRESEEEARQRKKFEDQIELTRKILFTKNPIWDRANAYMNYEERQRRVQQKEKQFQTLFPNGAKLAKYCKKWMF